MLERFLFDNCMSIELAHALAVLGQEVEHVRDIKELGGKATDLQIFEYSVKHGFAVLTTDDQIRKHPEQKAAYLRAGVGGFFIWQGSETKKKTKCDYVQLIIKAWPEIKRTARKSGTPFTKHVGRNGRVTNL